MTNHNIIEPEYSFIMAPFYLIGDDELMKSQLMNLNFQTDLSFEVIIPDPHYTKRSWISSFAKNLKYNLIHVPYVPNTKTPKSFDYGILNNAVLLSNTNKIITFQDWRFCNHRLIEELKINKEYKFIGFNWQILYKDSEVSSTHHSKSTIDIVVDDIKKLYEDGLFPEMEMNKSIVNTFHNACWGHYCIDKQLWLDVNGIDEVATNTRHYADLDINARLEYFHKKNGQMIEIVMIKNAMVRIMHAKGNFFGGSNIEIDHKYNKEHISCCFSKTGGMNDKVYTDYVVEKIMNNEYIKMYEFEYSKDFVDNDKNDFLDKEYSIIGFQCNSCGVIGETAHWYDKAPESRIKSMIGVGTKIKIGRNLKTIYDEINEKSFEEKVEILNNSWYDKKYLE